MCALQIQYTTQSGIVLDKAYCKVTRVDELDFINNYIRGQGFVYKDKQARLDGLDCVTNFVFEERDPAVFNQYFSDTAFAVKAPLKAIYSYLKTKPEFLQSTDV